jgi:hypothetical protein
MDRYKPGELVRVIGSRLLPEAIGRIIMITEPRQYREAHDGMTPYAYATDLTIDNLTFCPREECLAPLNYNGNEAGSWDDCIWKPKNIVSYSRFYKL